jgi:2-methylisocitrate lyase-like PEP mutase family enzyme
LATTDAAARARRFRAALERPEILVMPGGFSPLHARMAERLGFEAFFMAGSQVANYLFGLPDVGLLSLRDMADSARRLVDGCTLPIFADADTGYGNALNVYYTVQEYIRAGVAGLHIEDQEAPKKSGIYAGRRCISVAEAVGKYRAAVAARDELAPEVVICARCDFVGAEGGSFEGALERCLAYVEEAKVDVIWVNALETREQIAEACRRIPVPVIAPYYGPPPAPSIAELQALGVAVALYPACTSSVLLQPAWDFLHDLKAHGAAALEEWRARGRTSPWGEVPRDEILDLPRLQAREEAFLPGDLRRDYEGTFGHR